MPYAPEGRRLMPVFRSPLGPCLIGRLSLWALVARDACSISRGRVNAQTDAESSTDADRSPDF